MRSVTTYQVQIDPSTTLAWAIEYDAPVISSAPNNIDVRVEFGGKVRH
jgi:hypothetical protein